MIAYCNQSSTRWQVWYASFFWQHRVESDFQILVDFRNFTWFSNFSKTSCFCPKGLLCRGPPKLVMCVCLSVRPSVRHAHVLTSESIRQTSNSFWNFCSKKSTRKVQFLKIEIVNFGKSKFQNRKFRFSKIQISKIADFDFRKLTISWFHKRPFGPPAHGCYLV